MFELLISMIMHFTPVSSVDCNDWLGSCDQHGSCYGDTPIQCVGIEVKAAIDYEMCLDSEDATDIDECKQFDEWSK